MSVVIYGMIIRVSEGAFVCILQPHMKRVVGPIQSVGTFGDEGPEGHLPESSGVPFRFCKLPQDVSDVFEGSANIFRMLS